mgnify:CR=1 FL=1|tara:strand:+ start:105 stop:602 length:498 start_codon:yes stop_codon:yes gene_type:complete
MSYSAKKHFKSPTHLIDYSFSPQSNISTTITAYNGTEVAYTPTTSAAKVILEVNLALGYPDDSNKTLACTRLEESTDNGASWSSLDGFKMYEGNESGQYNSFSSPYFFVLPAYSGSKKFRLSGRSQDTSSEYSQGYSWDSHLDSTPPLFGAQDSPAHISIYSLEI